MDTSLQNIKPWNLGFEIKANTKLACSFDDSYGLRLYFLQQKDADKAIQIFFKSFLTYRTIDEGHYLKNPPFLGFEDHVFLLLDDSKYLDWFVEESCGIYEQNQLTHYVMATNDDIVEVISAYEPSWDIVDESEVLKIESNYLKNQWNQS